MTTEDKSAVTTAPKKCEHIIAPEFSWALVKIVAFMAAIIFLTGFMIAASYLWHWVGFAFAVGAVATTSIACYIAASSDE
jgi:accessory gene regulator protein AgrB